MKDTRLADAVDTVRTIVWVALDRQITFMAGSIAYSVFMSLIPLLLLVFVLGSALGGPELADRVIDMVETYLAPSGRELIRDAFTGENGRGGASFIGLAVLLWSTLKIFRGLDTAFAVIYDTEGSKSFVAQLRDGAITFVTVGAAILVTVVAGSVFVLFSNLPFLGLLNPVLLMLALTFAFLPLYYILPDTGVPLREAAPGAAVAALGWVVLEIVFQFYAASATGGTYDVIGGVVLLLSWLYFSGLIVMLGAVVNVVLAGRVDDTGAVLPDPVKHGPRDLIPDGPDAEVESGSMGDEGDDQSDETDLPADPDPNPGPPDAPVNPLAAARATMAGGEPAGARRFRGRALPTPERRHGRSPSRASVVLAFAALATLAGVHRFGRAAAIAVVPVVWVAAAVLYVAWPVVPTARIEKGAERLEDATPAP